MSDRTVPFHQHFILLAINQTAQSGCTVPPEMSHVQGAGAFEKELIARFADVCQIGNITFLKGIQFGGKWE